ncbi:hypothetical protein D1B17_01775 [Companilactobacillus zhachilii]|uniref:WxL domain-containing protein n=1 Tax=Companilactobacillus zhachilii TaxID=2304606 RepID=A0A386PPB3_9LACO|nr:hypothetical protein [Companilactobacillus zhachilii]AYE37456.1 hypothetical protein D1B17_01775 [Companilactobacillus zhachilii]
MKIFKNIVRLLVLTSLSMSLTPLTTAKATTNNEAIKVNNTTDSLAISYSANTTPTTEAASTDTSSNTTTTKADGSPATSTVSVTVLSGILTLEAVPDFNFGTMTVGSIGKLKSNVVNTDGFTVDDGTNTSDATAGRDGNTDGTLSVIDSRNNLKDMPGFTLSAAIGKLNPTNTDGGSTLDAILHLNPMPLVNEENNNVSNSATPLKTDKISVSSVTGNSAPVMNLTKGSYNGGLIKATFNTPDSASLEIPNTADNTKTSAKNMNAVVTWTLNAAPATTN